ncbi:hypothetical protein HanXRQr2_Chr05g0237541 [Helianthus annuus]|uniref:Uncharacterized protein n=1 Tax=Helianthus annuus TaxID=4232 RepID=A0A9K3NP12_HELAN|nr:hypothetical protein HanXRQr2_Chr05g0237541 [Helianthus annuus]KAJ0924524.1 hypothetical protein HanPSC8_Chr05g0229121 [Helianthus annuus]
MSNTSSSENKSMVHHHYTFNLKGVIRYVQLQQPQVLTFSYFLF